MRVNANEVNTQAAANKEKGMELQIQSSEAERKRQERIIAKLKSIEDELKEEEGEVQGFQEEDGGGQGQQEQGDGGAITAAADTTDTVF